MPKTKEIVRQIFKPLANRGLILIRLARSNLMLTRRAAFELSRWRGGRCCMGFLRVLLAV